VKASNERGAVAVEFALLVPLMVVILFAIIEFGIALTRTLAYTAGAREGARYAAVHCRPDATSCTNQLIQDRIEDSVDYDITFTNFSAGPDCSDPDNIGDIVTVTWEQDVPVSVPFLPDLSWTVHPTGAFRCE
jgi:Flp pilus assembly protein TadG